MEGHVTNGGTKRYTRQEASPPARPGLDPVRWREWTLRGCVPVGDELRLIVRDADGWEYRVTAHVVDEWTSTAAASCWCGNPTDRARSHRAHACEPWRSHGAGCVLCAEGRTADDHNLGDS